MSIRTISIAQQTSAKLYEDRDKTGDVIFKIGDEEISAHKCVLAALSPKYERQFFGDFDDKDKKVIEVNEPCVTAAAFNEFLQLFYLDKVNLSDENIEGVIFLAKESLVDQFYNECIKLLKKTLSIENVCQSYHLAILHECDDLMESCERKIESNVKGVFATKEFINCDRAMLSKILQLVPENCGAKDMFKACISWAKHFCAENDKDSANNEYLREALGDNLYRIPFGMMTIKEFMSYYRPYRSLFTDEERDEILLTISEVNDFKPKWFGGKTSNDQNPNNDRTISTHLDAIDALFEASKIGDVETVETLIENGADVNAVNEYCRSTALHSAAHSGHNEVVEILIENGADVNAVNEYEETALHLAAACGRTNVVRTLIENGADVNAVNEYCRSTALHRAARSGHNEVVEILIENGADVNAVNENGLTVLQFARTSSIWNSDIIQILFESDATDGDY